MTTSEDWPHEYAHRLRWLGQRVTALETQAGQVRERLAALDLALARQATAHRAHYEPNDEVGE